MLSEKAVLRELTRLDMVYGSRKSGDELDRLVKVFFEDCRHMSEHHFIEACRMHRREKAFFPVPAEILKQYDTLMANLPAPGSTMLLDLPTEISEEQARINREGIKMVRDRLANAKAIK